jgi:hypothetical protein
MGLIIYPRIIFPSEYVTFSKQIYERLKFDLEILGLIPK